MLSFGSNHATALALGACAALAGSAPPARAAEPFPFTRYFEAGIVGKFQVGMGLSEIESLIGDKVAPDLLKLHPLRLTLRRPNELEAVSLDELAGMPVQEIQLGFQEPVDGERHLRSIAVNVPCDAIPSLAQLFGSLGAEGTRLPYAWHLYNVTQVPACSLVVWQR